MPTDVPPLEDLTIADFRNIQVVPVKQVNRSIYYPSIRSVLTVSWFTYFQSVRELVD